MEESIRFILKCQKTEKVVEKYFFFLGIFSTCCVLQLEPGTCYAIHFFLMMDEASAERLNTLFKLSKLSYIFSGPLYADGWKFGHYV